LRFRNQDPKVSARAYSLMTDVEFERINACQAWANWRVLPPLIELVSAPAPWRIIDLGCGQGISTEVLAWCCPPGSSLLGYDLSEIALNIARNRVYHHSAGSAAKVSFRMQEIDQPWKDADGSDIGDSTIALVNASGVVGHHLSDGRMGKIADEIRRVLSPNGWALLDTGPQLSRWKLERIMQSRGFTHQSHVRSWWLDHCGQSAFCLSSA
jgi:SAM-dependent methyltransferase